MNETELKYYLSELAQDAFPDTLDPWPTLKKRLHMSDRKTHPRGFVMKTQTTRMKTFLPATRIVAILGLSLLLAGVIFLITPQGSALAQEIMHFFNRGESNLMPGVTVTPVKWVEQTPGVAASTLTPLPSQPTPSGPSFETVCGTYQAPHCTIEAIRKMVKFPAFALSRLPEGMRFAGATGGPDQIHLFYDTPNQTGFLILLEKPFTGAGSQLAMEVGADADIQSVQVGAIQAEYVKGSYDGNNNPPVWNSALDLQQLRWVNQGVLFTLYMNGTKPRLSRDELAALAATLTDGPVGEEASTIVATATPAPTDAPFDPRTAYPLTLAQVKEKAGFMPLSPSLLPERLTFIGAKYDEKMNIVEIFYKYNTPNYPEATEALIIREQLAPEGVDCDLCGFIQGNGKQVEQYPRGKLMSQDATMETVKIHNVSGQYLEGIGWTSGTECCGWQWDPEPYIKRLRFRTGGLAIDVTAYTYELTKADVLAIAEGMK